MTGQRRRPRVLYVDYSLGFGGAVKSLALTLREIHDIEKRVVTSQDAALIRAWLPDIPVRTFRRLINYRTKHRLADLFSVPVLRWGMTKGVAVADLVTTHRNAAWLTKFLRSQSIDLIHLNNGFTPPEVVIAANEARIPCVVHLRDYLHDRSTVSDEWARAVARVIVVSDAVGRSLEGTPIDPSSITTIYDPVDVGAIDAAANSRQRIRQACKLPNDAVAIGIFGRVIPWKGQLEFARAAAAAMRADRRIYAAIVGDESDGGRAYFDEVRQCIHQSGVADRFVLAGYRENVEEYYAAMDIVVHASITPEPFGMVVPEAMAAGCAVIAADAGGPREIITEGVDGLRVQPGDIEAMSRAMLALACDPAQRARLAAAGRHTAVTRFSIQESAARVVRVYEEVLR